MTDVIAVTSSALKRKIATTHMSDGEVTLCGSVVYEVVPHQGVALVTCIRCLRVSAVAERMMDPRMRKRQSAGPERLSAQYIDGGFVGSVTWFTVEHRTNPDDEQYRMRWQCGYVIVPPGHPWLATPSLASDESPREVTYQEGRTLGFDARHSQDRWEDDYISRMFADMPSSRLWPTVEWTSEKMSLATLEWATHADMAWTNLINGKEDA